MFKKTETFNIFKKDVERIICQSIVDLILVLSLYSEN